MAHKVSKYRIFPSKAQTSKLQKSLDACRWLYNHFLEQRKNSWEAEKKGLSRYDQTNTIPTHLGFFKPVMPALL